MGLQDAKIKYCTETCTMYAMECPIVPIVPSYCPRCDGIVYDYRAVDGKQKPNSFTGGIINYRNPDLLNFCFACDCEIGKVFSAPRYKFKEPYCHYWRKRENVKVVETHLQSRPTLGNLAIFISRIFAKLKVKKNEEVRNEVEETRC